MIKRAFIMVVIGAVALMLSGYPLIASGSDDWEEYYTSAEFRDAETDLVEVDLSEIKYYDEQEVMVSGLPVFNDYNEKDDVWNLVITDESGERFLSCYEKCHTKKNIAHIKDIMGYIDEAIEAQQEITVVGTYYAEGNRLSLREVSVFDEERYRELVFDTDLYDRGSDEEVHYKVVRVPVKYIEYVEVPSRPRVYYYVSIHYCCYEPWPFWVIWDYNYRSRYWHFRGSIVWPSIRLCRTQYHDPDREPRHRVVKVGRKKDRRARNLRDASEYIRPVRRVMPENKRLKVTDNISRKQVDRRFDQVKRKIELKTKADRKQDLPRPIIINTRDSERSPVINRLRPQTVEKKIKINRGESLRPIDSGKSTSILQVKPISRSIGQKSAKSLMPDRFRTPPPRIR